ncbi:MAG: FAD:protein FMN transferase [Actinomycetota bacterium]
MGTEFQVFLVGPDPDQLSDVAHHVLDEVEGVEARLSHYRADSEISDLNLRAAYEPVLMERSVFDLVRRCVEFSERSHGAFDVTTGPLIRCWGFFRGEGRLADSGAVQEALKSVGSRLLELNAEERTIRFKREGVQVHLGGVGKGYAVDEVVEWLRRLGVEAALVHGGTSTVYALGAPPGEDAWRVGLCDPNDRTKRLGVVKLRDRALSTSGDYEQFFEVAGKRYSHILDPRTGFPAAGKRSATVVADNATDTDALTTAAFVLGEEGARDLLASYPGIGVILATGPGSDESAEIVVMGEVALNQDDGSPTLEEIGI